MPKKPIPSPALTALAVDLAALIERHGSHAQDRDSRVLVECLRHLLHDANARIAQ